MKALRMGVLVSTFAILTVAATQAFGQVNPGLADQILEQALSAEEVASNSEGASSKFEAAQLHEESARLRAMDDPKAVSSLRAAGLYLAYDRPARAAELLVEAAERALAIGDIVTSATSYIDAASVLTGTRYRTTTLEDIGKARSWMSQAATLATLPEVSDAERERILRRVGLDMGHYAG